MWLLVIYSVITHTTVLSADSGLNDLGVENDFTTSQHQRERQRNLTTIEPFQGSITDISSESVEKTTTQNGVILTMTNENSISGFTKRETPFYTTTKAPSVRTRGTDMKTASPTDENVTNYKSSAKPIGGTTKNETHKTTNKLTQTTRHTNEQTTKANMASKTTYTTETVTKLTSIAKEVSKRANTTSETTKHKSVSSITQPAATSPTLISVSSVSAGRSVVTALQTTRSSHTTLLNSTADVYNSTTDPNRLSHTLADDFQSRDSFWPIAMALTIGIPIIVVLAVTITVLYRGRLAKPRSLLAMYGQDYSQM